MEQLVLKGLPARPLEPWPASDRQRRRPKTPRRVVQAQPARQFTATTARSSTQPDPMQIGQKFACRYEKGLSKRVPDRGRQPL